VCCFKPQIAYFAAHRAEDQLEALIEHIHAGIPASPVILDAKRGDIGSTAEQYAIEAFERFKADAMTVNPYMGRDSVDPYLAWPEKGVILLCRTSNPGGSDLQFLEVGPTAAKLYEHVARTGRRRNGTPAASAPGRRRHLPGEIARVRALVGDMPLLVPGIGAQGGDIEATVAAGRTANGTGLMINSSRAPSQIRIAARKPAMPVVPNDVPVRIPRPVPGCSAAPEVALPAHGRWRRWRFFCLAPVGRVCALCQSSAAHP
jgi:orotidine-5'-phosphate decarboxylase